MKVKFKKGDYLKFGKNIFIYSGKNESYTNTIGCLVGWDINCNCDVVYVNNDYFAFNNFTEYASDSEISKFKERVDKFFKERNEKFDYDKLKIIKL